MVFFPTLSELMPRTSPQAQIHNLENSITGFGLDKGTENSLMSKLDAAFNALQRGNANAACGQLGAVINYAAAQSGKKLTAAQAAMVVSSAQTIRTRLGCK